MNKFCLLLACLFVCISTSFSFGLTTWDKDPSLLIPEISARSCVSNSVCCCPQEFINNHPRPTMNELFFSHPPMEDCICDSVPEHPDFPSCYRDFWMTDVDQAYAWFVQAIAECDMCMDGTARQSCACMWAAWSEFGQSVNGAYTKYQMRCLGVW